MIETEAAPTAQPYSPSVLDLIKVSTEVCHTLEHVRELSREELVRRMLVMLPMVYLKVQLIGNVDSQPGWRQQRLTEDDYNYIREGVSAVMAERDDYLDVSCKTSATAMRPSCKLSAKTLPTSIRHCASW